MTDPHPRRRRPGLVPAPAVVLAVLLTMVLTALGSSPAGAEAGEGTPAARAATQAIAAGQDHTCAIVNDGSVRCWGDNAAGELGQGNTTTIGDDPGESTVRVDLGPGRTAKAIAAGGHDTCAILDTGDLRCWGANGDGELAQGNTTTVGANPGSTTVRVDLGVGRTAAAVSVGAYHSCAILDNGKLLCWGDNQFGKLGQGNTTTVGDGMGHPNTVEVNLGTGRTAVAVTAGTNTTCAILDNAKLLCWGRGGDGELGQGTSTTNAGDGVGGHPNTVEVNLGAGRTARAVAIGEYHVCAILDNGQLDCWGFNATGELGRGLEATSSGDATVPVNLGAGRTAVALSAGTRSACAVLDNGGLRCWGRNNVGQLGQGNTADVGDNAGETPVLVNLGGRAAVAVVEGDTHTCARLAEGSVRCWGRSQLGQSGRGTTATYGINPGEVPANLPDIILIPPPPVPPVEPTKPVPTPPGAVLKGKKVVVSAPIGIKKATRGCPKKATVSVTSKGKNGKIKVTSLVKTRSILTGGALTGCLVTGKVKLPFPPDGLVPIKVKVTGPNLKSGSLLAARG